LDRGGRDRKSKRGPWYKSFNETSEKWGIRSLQWGAIMGVGKLSQKEEKIGIIKTKRKRGKEEIFPFGLRKLTQLNLTRGKRSGGC